MDVLLEGVDLSFIPCLVACSSHIIYLSQMKISNSMY